MCPAPLFCILLCFVHSPPVSHCLRHTMVLGEHYIVSLYTCMCMWTTGKPTWQSYTQWLCSWGLSLTTDRSGQSCSQQRRSPSVFLAMAVPLGSCGWENHRCSSLASGVLLFSALMFIGPPLPRNTPLLAYIHKHSHLLFIFLLCSALCQLTFFAKSLVIDPFSALLLDTLPPRPNQFWSRIASVLFNVNICYCGLLITSCRRKVFIFACGFRVKRKC